MDQTDLEARFAELERRLAAMERRLPPAPEARPALTAAPPAAKPPPRTPQSARPRPPEMTTEDWIGQRGILAVGVILVILAVGYLLKLAFDRNWISPAVRCAGGVVLGGTGAAIGWRLHPRYRQYGAAVIGLGFGIIYLAMWAAASVYRLVPPGLDIAALTLVSLALASAALILDEEALGAAAAVGAFFAPIVIGARGNPDTLLLYLAMIGATLGAAASVKRWRRAMAVVVVAFFGLGLLAALSGATPWRVGLLAMGGAAGMVDGLRWRWPETRVLSFVGGWALLGAAAPEAGWLVAIGGIVLSAPLWWHAVRTSHIWPDPRVTGESEAEWLLDETLPFYATPVLLGWAVTQLSPAWFAGHPGAAPFIVALGYLAAGYQQPRYPFALVGAAAAAYGTLVSWPSWQGVYVLLALALLWAGLDHWRARFDGRWYAAGTLAVAIWHLVMTSGVHRGAGPAFVDGWAGALWFTIIVAGVLAGGLWMRLPGESVKPPAKDRKAPATFTQTWVQTREDYAPLMPAVLWTTAGALLFLGVTGELGRAFLLSTMPAWQARLWSGLSVSAWWAAFAGGLVALGFRREIRPVRIAGLIVAGLAVAKVLVVDLSSLDALYRVGSTFILGTVSLLVAYLYHRRARAAINP